MPLDINAQRLRRILASEGLIKSARVPSKRDSGRRMNQLREKHGGSTVAYFQAVIAEVEDSLIAPAAVVGGGYKNGKKVAIKWLLDQMRDQMRSEKTASRKIAHRPHFVTPRELRDGHAFMTYKIDAVKNNSKFYEGKMTPAADGSWSLLKRWGALTDKGTKTGMPVQGERFDRHGLSEAKAQGMLDKEKRKRLGPRGYADAMKSRPLGQYPVGLDRPGNSGPWGQQSITQCVPALRDMSELIGTAVVEVQQDDAQDFLRALEGLVLLTGDLPASSMAKEIAKMMRSPVQRMKKNPRFIDDPSRTMKELMTLKRYIDRQTKECNI